MVRLLFWGGFHSSEASLLLRRVLHLLRRAPFLLGWIPLLLGRVPLILKRGPLLRRHVPFLLRRVWVQLALGALNLLVILVVPFSKLGYLSFGIRSGASSHQLDWDLRKDGRFRSPFPILINLPDWHVNQKGKISHKK